MKTLNFPLTSPCVAESAGLFVSQTGGIHPDRTLKSHELIFVRSGTLHIAEQDRVYAVAANECLLLRPHLRHFGTQPYSKDLSFYWIHFYPRGAKGGLKLPIHTQPARPERLRELFHRFLDDQESDSLLPEQAACLVGEMLIELTRPPKPEIPSLAGRAEQFIAKNCLKGIHAGDVAKHLQANPDYLGRLFRRAFGRTLSQSIHQKQLAEARHLLRESAHNLEEIARACGFPESRYFRELFTTHQGMSPRTYRRLYARLSIFSR